MSFALRKGWQFALIAFVAALGGVLVGRSIAGSRPVQSSALHQLLHDQLRLDRDQHARIEALERDYAVRRRALELEIRASNARLAAAIEAEHAYGPRVTAEVDRLHQAMGQLQNATLSHIFAMRAVLRPDQARQFDQAVVRTLTADAG